MVGLIIQNIEDGVIFTKETKEVSIRFNIASDFQYNNSEGKLTVPWFDYIAFVQINNQQTKSICYSNLQEKEVHEIVNDKAHKDIMDEWVEETEKVTEGMKGKQPTFKRRRRSTSNQVNYTPTLQEVKETAQDNSLFNDLRESNNTLLLKNNSGSNKPKEQKYRAYLSIPTKKLNQKLEYENADYNHELEVMAYIESEDDPTESNEIVKLSLEDSSFFIETQLLELTTSPLITKEEQEGESEEEI